MYKDPALRSQRQHRLPNSALCPSLSGYSHRKVVVRRLGRLGLVGVYASLADRGRFTLEGLPLSLCSVWLPSCPLCRSPVSATMQADERHFNNNLNNPRHSFLLSSLQKEINIIILVAVLATYNIVPQPKKTTNFFYYRIYIL